VIPYVDLPWIEAVGWLASLLTVACYSMRSMIPLRIFAIASSLAFLIYGIVLQVWPLVFMEVILLPLNVWRFWQILALRARLERQGAGDPPDFSVIKAYGKARNLAPDTLIFAKGDKVEHLYYIASGRVSIEEVGVELGAGDILGEIGFFTDAETRTATARCIEAAEVHQIDKTRFLRLQFEDPTFGMSVMRSVTRRLANRPA